MGLTIHYSGKLKNKKLLSDLTEEVKDICEVYKWEHHIFKTEFPEDTFGKKEFTGEVYGIIFTPPGCETVSLAFLSNGKLCSPAMLMFYSERPDAQLKKLITGVHVKTQYAGMQVHNIIIRLFKHLSPKYLKNFKMMDEGGFWESGDEKVLAENFRSYEELLDSVSFALESFPFNEGEDFTEYFKRVLGTAAKNIEVRKITPKKKKK